MDNNSTGSSNNNPFGSPGLDAANVTTQDPNQSTVSSQPAADITSFATHQDVPAQTPVQPTGPEVSSQATAAEPATGQSQFSWSEQPPQTNSKVEDIPTSPPATANTSTDTSTWQQNPQNQNPLTPSTSSIATDFSQTQQPSSMADVSPHLSENPSQPWLGQTTQAEEPISAQPTIDPNAMPTTTGPVTNQIPTISNPDQTSGNVVNNHPTAPEVGENAPTDLSQLTATSNGNGENQAQPGIYNPQVSAPEALVVPPDLSLVSNEPESQGSTKKFPVMAIIGAIILLVIVGVATAYFILGIGQPKPATNTASPDQSSTSGETTSQESSTSATSPVLNTTPPSTTGSATFGQLNGSTPAPSISSATGSSALDLLRQRQK